jgi:hypothetical protein
MSFSKYKQTHEPILGVLVNDIARNKMAVDQCGMMIQYFKYAISLLKAGTPREELFQDERINGFKLFMKDIFNKDYAFNANDVDALINELFEIEEGQKQIKVKNNDLKKELGRYVAKFPLPYDTPTDIKKNIKSMIESTGYFNEN